MSSEIDHPHQRTVAELLAEHGDAGGSGRRRRRREAEADTSEPADDAAFVYGGAAPELTRWAADRSVLRDPVPPDDGTPTWDPIGAARANGSTHRAARATDARGRGADVGGSGPPVSDRAPTSGYPDNDARNGRSPFRGPGGDASEPTPAPAGAPTGSRPTDDGTNGWSFDRGTDGGLDSRASGDGSGGPRDRGRAAVNGWSGGSDVDASSWSSGGGPEDFGPAGPGGDRFGTNDSGSPGSGSDGSGPARPGPDRSVPDAPAGRGWAHGGVPSVDANGSTARGDVPLRNGSTNRSPAIGIPDRGPEAGTAYDARAGARPRTADGGVAYAAMLADLEPDRPQGTARLAIPLRDAPHQPRAGDARPTARRAPDNVTRQLSPVRGDSTAVVEPGQARPVAPARGVGDDHTDGAPTRSADPFARDDADRPAGLGRTWSGPDQADPTGTIPDRRPADSADLDDLDGPQAAPVRSRRKAPSSSGQAWAGVLAQWILGAIGGAALWVGFRFLWQELTVVAVAAAVLVTVGLVLVVRHLLRNDDRRTTVFAVLIGLLLTVSPALLVLLHR